MKHRIGLTGSIGMGKSTTARLFAEAGCPVWDADAAVHRLYAKGGAAVAVIGAAFPDAVRDGAVSRDALRAIIASDPTALVRIESLVHPLVQADRAAFARDHENAIGVFDIPLLFETGAESEMDTIVVVSVDAETQRKRVLGRGSMTTEDLDRILDRQMPDAEKRARADAVVITDTLDHARAQVHNILRKIEERPQDHA